MVGYSVSIAYGAVSVPFFLDALRVHGCPSLKS